jgi:hypothetical protein
MGNKTLDAVTVAARTDDGTGGSGLFGEMRRGKAAPSVSARRCRPKFSRIRDLEPLNHGENLERVKGIEPSS